MSRLVKTVRANELEQEEIEENVELVRLSDVEELLAACDALDDAQLRWFQNSGPFRHICKALMKQRGITFASRGVRKDGAA